MLSDVYVLVDAYELPFYIMNKSYKTKEKEENCQLMVIRVHM